MPRAMPRSFHFSRASIRARSVHCVFGLVPIFWLELLRPTLVAFTAPAKAPCCVCFCFLRRTLPAVTSFSLRCLRSVLVRFLSACSRLACCVRLGWTFRPRLFDCSLVCLRNLQPFLNSCSERELDSRSKSPIFRKEFVGIKTGRKDSLIQYDQSIDQSVNKVCSVFFLLLFAH